MQRTRELTDRYFVEWGQRLRRYAKTCCMCNHCGSKVSWLADSCPACGSRLPSIVPVSPQLLVTTLFSLAAIVILKST